MPVRYLMSLLWMALPLLAEKKDERKLKPDHLPTPYTAAEIRAASLDGRASTYLIEVPGQEAVRQTLRFLKPDAKGVTFEYSRTKQDGTPLGPAASSRATWKELQAHASYPQKSTKVTDARMKTPAGDYACRLYTQTEKAKGKTTVQRFYFATKLPGPPVKAVIEQDGKAVYTMTLVEHKQGKKPQTPKPEAAPSAPKGAK